LEAGGEIMGQWGEPKNIGGVKFVPYINTGTNPFTPARPFDLIEKIFAIDKDQNVEDVEVDRLEKELNKQYQHKPYKDWTCA